MGILRYYTGILYRSILPRKAVASINRMRRSVSARHLAGTRRRIIGRYGLFGVDELHEELVSAGVRTGGVLMVHSDFGRFYNFQGSALDVLNVLQDIVGSEGTLMMPTHVNYSAQGPFTFDVCRSGVCTGIIPELFRRAPGVRRSLHPMFSCCAKGPLAMALVGDHHKDQHNNFGPLSPYARLAERQGQVLGLGLPPGYSTLFHAAEDMRLETFRNLYSGESTEFLVTDETGHQFPYRVRRFNSKVLATRKLTRLTKHLSSRSHRAFSIRGIPAFLDEAAPFVEEVLVLTDQGITLYGGL